MKHIYYVNTNLFIKVMPELLFVRDYNVQTMDLPNNINRINQQCDAMLHAATKNDSIPSMEMINDVNWVINAIDVPIILTQDITLKIIDITRSKTVNNSIQIIKFKIYSETLSVKALIAYVTKLFGEYNSHIQHDLLGQQFYFDQKYRNNERQEILNNPFDDNPKHARKYIINHAPKHLSFMKYKFSSNKT